MIDLDDWSQDHQMPVWPCLRQFPEQLEIHSLVNHTEESEAGMRNFCLIGRISLLSTSLFKMRGINTAWEQVHIVMPVAFALIKRLSAGEDQVGSADQFLFQFAEFFRCAFEQGKLIHAVVDGQRRLKVTGKI